MTGEHYALISADCHAGGSHQQYREYLDADLRDEFDTWREKYKNPFKDLKKTDDRIRNWDDEVRLAQQEADGTVGEIVFPNTVPPFFPSYVLFAGPPTAEDYRQRLAGIRAHNRWAVDFQNAQADRRAVIGQVFLNDVDDAIVDARWIKEHGLKGGVLLPNIAPDVHWVKPLYHPDYDPFWRVCEELELVVNVHSGTGSPNYGDFPFSALLQAIEIPFYSQRPLVQLMVSGVFERFPKLKFVVTELGASWIPETLGLLDMMMGAVRGGQLGEFRYEEGGAPQLSATDYFKRNVWVGMSFPNRRDVKVRELVGADRLMWGSDYPHDEGSYPNTKQAINKVFNDVDPTETAMMLGGNAADLYGFDLAKLQPLAERFGPSVAEVHAPRERQPA
ncbi:MAG: amidohydrolase [Actinomycetota bacterium]|nr:amidohydrolase [Actinomycetota bacterium]